MLAPVVAAAQGAHNAGDTEAAPPGALTPAQRAERRWPQPVRVGDLANRLVLDPSQQQAALGRVSGVERTADGAVRIVVRYGGFLGFGGREIAVPVETTALLGPYLQIVDLDRQQLDAAPTWSARDGVAVPADERIRVGINRN